MSIRVEKMSEDEAVQIIRYDEGQFGEIKSADISPASLSKTISAFANSDGGDLYIGIEDKPREWRGFKNQEAANGHIQCFNELFPLGSEFRYEFLESDEQAGLILHVFINKSQEITYASNKVPYIRRGAQNLPLNDPASLKRLEYTKGLTSFETRPVNVDTDIITESEPTIEFIKSVVPQQNPTRWLKKQQLIFNDKPAVSGILLFADEPQAIMPKRCGIKVYRYKTKEPEGFRDALAFNPETIEGWLYEQIKRAVRFTKETVESIPRMGEDSLETITYPDEALHEIITNAVLHRDYSVADDVHIRIFDNRIEVESPGRLPAHITTSNILDERFARNGAVVRILNKFPDPPNKDVGEGLNTAFTAMHKLGLKDPIILERENSVLVILKHEPLASPEEAILKFLESHSTINNSEARDASHINEDHRVRSIFRRMEEAKLIERVPGSRTANTRYRKYKP